VITPLCLPRILSGTVYRYYDLCIERRRPLPS